MTTRKMKPEHSKSFSQAKDVINLQLKKPKSWAWSLSTSKSSPNIILPIINIYNSKGDLLIKATDNGSGTQVWNSRNIKNEKQKPISNLLDLKKCNSNIFELNNRVKDIKVNRCASKANLQKSKSEILESKHLIGRDQEELINILNKHGHRKSSNNVYRQKKMKSDDCYQRLMKFNEERFPGEYTNLRLIKHINNNKNLKHDGMNGTTLNNESEDSNYKTISCSAGTLIIKEPSIKSSNNRRHRRNKSSDNISISNTKGRCFGSSENNNILKLLKNNKDKYAIKQIDGCSIEATNNCTDQYYKCAHLTPKRRTSCHLNSNTCLCERHKMLNYDTNGNCVIEEPLMPNEKIRKFSWSFIECANKLTKLQLLENNIDEALQLYGLRKNINRYRNDKYGMDNWNCVPESNLNNFTPVIVDVTSHNNDKMGANVSRHSSKGLDGRRSQSSGSICNGKGGRRTSSGDGQFCGSLPSYLDSNVCNNNHHDCEKSSMGNVERIPPLGDAAPLHWKFSDNQTVFCDQGYGSERSPEEEYPPSLPEHDVQCLHHMESHSFSFITPESTFTVSLIKGSRGLGLSVTGGSDSNGSWPGLIRIKRLFPHQPAAVCGLLNVGDLLLEVNGITLTGLTNYEALEVLRTTPGRVDLKVCRPPPDVLSCVSPISEVPPPPPRRDAPLNLTPPPYQPTPEDDFYHGEFEITLTKIQGSLGFTLRKEDDDSSSHYVRALVREPAISDGRIHAGDKIIAVNNVEISSLTHEQAVQFLRQAGSVVTLRLFRDSIPTPVSTLSPSELTPRTSFSRKVPLRPEAMDMLNDIAMRKLVNHDSYLQTSCSNTSPRKLKRQTCPADSFQINDNCNEYLITDEQFHEGLFRNSIPGEDEDVYNSLFSIDSDEGDRPNRPISLDLCNSKGTPVITRKPKFNFSLAHNAYELNNLDPEILDAPNLTYNLGKDDNKNTKVETTDSYSEEPVSMPQIPINNPRFSYKNPSYQSAHPPCVEKFDNTTNSQTNGDNTMKKWKGSALNTDQNKKQAMKIDNEYEVLAVELNRGWNSRLGFSLQGTAGVTYISAVYADSVAARDGRLKPGDRLIKVNDESVENMTTGEIIDLLRIVRGPVCIIISRNKSL